MSERAKVLLEVSRWAGEKRDSRRIGVPITLSTNAQEGAWRDGYRTAMNEVAQHFNMERIAAEDMPPADVYPLVSHCGLCGETIPAESANFHILTRHPEAVKR